MTQGSFAADVGAWAAQTRERMEAIRRESAQRVVEIMQTPVAKGGNMPIDTGFLRASLMGVIGTGTLPARPNPNPKGSFTYDAGQINLVIAGSKLTDTITVGFTANYARHVNYGSRGHQARQFVGLAAQQWPRVVSEVAAEAQRRAK